MQSAAVKMRLSAQGSSCTSSCMAIINTSSECKGKCVLTVWDNQCLSEGCIIEALWKYTALAIDVSKWLLMCKDMSFEIESIPMHYYFSMQPNFNFNIMREIFFYQIQCWRKLMSLVFSFFSPTTATLWIALYIFAYIVLWRETSSSWAPLANYYIQIIVKYFKHPIWISYSLLTYQ